MSRSQTQSSGQFVNLLFNSVATELRRSLLSILCDRNSPIETEELATHLTARVHEKELVAVTREDRQQMTLRLVHELLPALEDAGLVSWDREAETVTASGHAILSTPLFRSIVTIDDPTVDPVLRALSDHRSRLTLSTLHELEETIDTTNLASEITAREAAGEDTDENRSDSTTETDALRVELHHVILPKLADAGLVAYDPADGIVESAEHPAFQNSWLEGSAGGSVETLFATASQ